MNSLRLICGFLILATAQISYANIPGLAAAYGRALQGTQSAIASSGALASAESGSCNRQILDIAQDRKINITVAFGYMDISDGQESESLASSGHTVDRDAKQALQDVLLTQCPSYGGKGRRATLSACGFRQNGKFLTKKITDRFSNKNILVNVRLAAPSETSSNSRNSVSAKQRILSQATKSAFHSGLQRDDVVIYLGHARSGGGPDFSPPVLLANGHVNYAYYRQKQAGIGEMLGALSQANPGPYVLGVLACKSTGLFANSIRRYSGNSILITAGDLFNYDDILPTGYAMLEAVVGQRCTDAFTTIVKIQPASSRFLKVSF